MDVFEFRKAKDDFYRNGSGSPFKTQGVPFKKLNYFDPDPAFVLKARFVENPGKERVTLQTSLGYPNVYVKQGWFEFELEGQKLRLAAFKSAKQGGNEAEFFIPFKDKTSGTESYPAARYLEVEEKTDKTADYALDFNYAYNPYCAYVDGYACPFPPAENILPVAIKAGEKKYHD